jgi:predicted ATPase
LRLIVETHSEYLVTRIRLLVAQGQLRPSDVSVMFASQERDPEQKGTAVETRFKHLNVDELGNFDVWPHDFFDALDRESVEIARAVAERVANKRSTTES